MKSVKYKVAEESKPILAWYVGEIGDFVLVKDNNDLVKAIEKWRIKECESG